MKSVTICGRTIANPFAVQLAQHMTEDRALFVATLRVERGLTYSSIAEECGRCWSRDWESSQVIGAALCELSGAYFGEDGDWLDGLIPDYR